MSYALVVIVVAGTAVAAGLLAWITRRSVRLDTLQRHHEIGGAVFLQLGVIYAVLLAFVLSEVWSEYNAAANAISQECGNLHGASILSEALPPAMRDPFQSQLRTYLGTVIEREWPEMERGRPSDVARHAFGDLWRIVSTAPPDAALDEAIRSQLMSQLAAANQARETRLFQMNLSVPRLMWALLIGLGLVLVGFLLCFGIEYVGSQVIFTAVFAGSIALALALVQCFDFPFQGAMRLAPTDFRATLALVTHATGG